jgi:hypothetical protein
LYPIGGGEPTEISGYQPGEGTDQFSADGRFLYIHPNADVPIKVQRLELATGRREPWRTLMPADGAGVSQLSPVITPDGSAYALSYVRTLSDLFLVDGVK